MDAPRVSAEERAAAKAAAKAEKEAAKAAAKAEKEAAKAAAKAAKDAVKAKKAEAKDVKAKYKGWSALLKSKVPEEVRDGLSHAANKDYLVYGGGLVALCKTLKSKDAALVKSSITALTAFMAPESDMSDSSVVAPPSAASVLPMVTGESPPVSTQLLVSLWTSADQEVQRMALRCWRVLLAAAVAMPDGEPRGESLEAMLTAGEPLAALLQVLRGHDAAVRAGVEFPPPPAPPTPEAGAKGGKGKAAPKKDAAPPSEAKEEEEDKKKKKKKSKLPPPPATPGAAVEALHCLRAVVAVLVSPAAAFEFANAELDGLVAALLERFHAVGCPAPDGKAEGKAEEKEGEVAAGDEPDTEAAAAVESKECADEEEAAGDATTPSSTHAGSDGMLVALLGVAREYGKGDGRGLPGVCPPPALAGVEGVAEATSELVSHDGGEGAPTFADIVARVALTERSVAVVGGDGPAPVAPTVPAQLSGLAILRDLTWTPSGRQAVAASGALPHILATLDSLVAASGEALAADGEAEAEADAPPAAGAGEGEEEATLEALWTELEMLPVAPTTRSHPTPTPTGTLLAGCQSGVEALYRLYAAPDAGAYLTSDSKEEEGVSAQAPALVDRLAAVLALPPSPATAPVIRSACGVLRFLTAHRQDCRTQALASHIPRSLFAMFSALEAPADLRDDAELTLHQLCRVAAPANDPTGGTNFTLGGGHPVAAVAGVDAGVLGGDDNQLGAEHLQAAVILGLTPPHPEEPKEPEDHKAKKGKPAAKPKKGEPEADTPDVPPAVTTPFGSVTSAVDTRLRGMRFLATFGGDAGAQETLCGMGAVPWLVAVIAAAAPALPPVEDPAGGAGEAAEAAAPAEESALPAGAQEADVAAANLEAAVLAADVLTALLASPSAAGSVVAAVAPPSVSRNLTHALLHVATTGGVVALLNGGLPPNHVTRLADADARVVALAALAALADVHTVVPPPDAGGDDDAAEGEASPPTPSPAEACGLALVPHLPALLEGIGAGFAAAGPGVRTAAVVAVQAAMGVPNACAELVVGELARRAAALPPQEPDESGEAPPNPFQLPGAFHGGEPEEEEPEAPAPTAGPDGEEPSEEEVAAHAQKRADALALALDRERERSSCMVLKRFMAPLMALLSAAAPAASDAEAFAASRALAAVMAPGAAPQAQLTADLAMFTFVRVGGLVNAIALADRPSAAQQPESKLDDAPAAGRIPLPPSHVHGFTAPGVADGALTPDALAAWRDVLLHLAQSVVSRPLKGWQRALNLGHTCARYDANGKQRYTPLLAAVTAHLDDLVAALLGANVDPNATGFDDDDDGDEPDDDIARMSPLVAALSQGCEGMVTALLGAGANPDYRCPDTGATVLQYAMAAPSREAVSTLAEDGVPPSAQPAHGDTVCRLVAAVVSAGADPNISFRDGRFPVHWAVDGVSVSTRQRSQVVTVEYTATADTACAVLETLVGGRAALDTGDDKKQTALHVSLLGAGMAPASLLLIKLGANPNKLDGFGNLPLHLAGLGRGFKQPGGALDAVAAALLDAGDDQPITPAVFDNSRNHLDDSGKLLTDLNAILDGCFSEVVSPKTMTMPVATRSDLINTRNGAGLTPVLVAAGGEFVAEAVMSVSGVASDLRGGAFDGSWCSGLSTADLATFSECRSAVLALLTSHKGVDTSVQVPAPQAAADSNGTTAAHLLAASWGDLYHTISFAALVEADTKALALRWSAAHKAMLSTLLESGVDTGAAASACDALGKPLGVSLTPFHVAAWHATNAVKCGPMADDALDSLVASGAGPQDLGGPPLKPFAAAAGAGPCTLEGLPLDGGGDTRSSKPSPDGASDGGWRATIEALSQ